MPAWVETLLSKKAQLARLGYIGPGWRYDFNLKRIPLTHVLSQMSKVVFGDVEIDVDRILELDIDQSRSTNGNVITWIDQPATGTAVPWGSDIAIFEIEFG